MKALVTRFRSSSTWLLLLAVLVAALFRLPLLSELPPGLNFDEAGNGIAALDVAQGNFKLMWDIGGGKEPLIAYLLQPLFWLFGPTTLALRLYAALWGIITVVATFFLARKLFSPETNSIYLTWLPAFAAFGLATAFWHVAYSRIAFRAAAMPALEALALAFLWAGFHTRRRRNFVLAGLFLGLSVYSYLPARFIPIVIGLFLLVQAGLALRQKTIVLLKSHWPNLSLTTGLAFLIFLPLGIFFLFNPEAISNRAAAVSIFSPAMNQGDFWGTLWRTIGLTVGTFLSLTGDPNPFGNIPGLPQLNPILAIAFVIGFITTLARWRQPTYLFLLVWWPIMLLPGILAPEDAPHHLRLIGAAPATYILVGLGLTQIVIGLVRLTKQTQPAMVASFLLVVIFGITGWQTYRQYFSQWAGLDHYLSYDLYVADLVEQISAENDQTLAYIIPMDLRAAHEARHYALDFLYRGQVPFHYLPVDEQTVTKKLTEAAKNKTVLKVIRWTQDKHAAADEKELVTFLLHYGGAVLTQRESYRVYDVETYQLPNAPSFALPTIEQPIDVTLDNLLQIRRAIVSPGLTTMNEVAVGVTYARITSIEVDYKASLRLVGPDGGMVAQTDRPLRHNWHQPTSLWPAEEVNEYYLLPLPPEAVSGTYEVWVVVYHPDTLAPLTENGLVEVSLGKVTIP